MSVVPLPLALHKGVGTPLWGQSNLGLASLIGKAWSVTQNGTWLVSAALGLDKH